MKQLKTFMLLLFSTALVLPACNNGTTEKTAAANKITELPASSASKEAVATFREGLAAFDLGDINKARELFSKAIGQDPKFGLAYLYRANTSTNAKEFADDINAGKANLDSTASEWEKTFAEIQASNLSGDRIKGLELAQKAASTYPDAARAQADLGNAYAGSNQYDKSREAYQKAIQLDPKWVGGYAGLTASYLFNDPKDLKKAEENALQVVELAPTSAGAQITLGDCYRAQSDFTKAKDAYAKAISLAPNAPEAYYKSGHANSYLGNFEEARKNYTDGGSHDNTKVASVLNIANTYLYAGDTKTAMKYLMDEAAKVDAAGGSKSANTAAKSAYLNNCASIAIHTNDAATYKQLAPQLKMMSEEINNDLGTAEGKMFAKSEAAGIDAMAATLDGKFDEAKAKAEEMKTALDGIKDDRKLENYHFIMGMISMKQKNYGDAVSHFEKSDMNYMYNKYWLAVANEAAGNKDKAMSLYKECAAYNFNDVGNGLMRNEVKKKISS